MSTIKQILIDAQYSQSTAAKRVGISAPSFNLLINRGVWPARKSDKVRQNLRDLLIELGVTEPEADTLIADIGTLHTPSIFDPLKHQRGPEKEEKESMLISKQTLTPEAKRLFNIINDPFSDALPGPEGVFLSPSIRYARESMMYTARNSGLLAVIGESGSGKSTLRRDLIDRCSREKLPIVFIEPYILGMVEDARKGGKALEAHHIADAVLLALKQRPAHSIHGKYRQMHEALQTGYDAGQRYCIIIEEAHDLAPKTLKQLKRFFELEKGFSRLLSIILIGQTELADRLSASDYSIREVVQRMDVITIEPLDDLQGYVEHRLKTAKLAYNEIFARDAIDALKEVLTGPPNKGHRTRRLLWYPLAVGNVLKAAMNIAAETCEKLVTGGCIRRLKKSQEQE